jgi:hypothetical protein
MSRYKHEVGTKTTASTTVCFATLQGVAGKHIVNSIDLKEIKATAMEIILKKWQGDMK